MACKCGTPPLDLGSHSDDIAHRLQKGILAEPTMRVGQEEMVPACVKLVQFDNRLAPAALVIVPVHLACARAVPSAACWRMHNCTRREIRTPWDLAFAEVSSNGTILVKVEVNQCHHPFATERLPRWCLILVYSRYQQPCDRSRW
jgi:hypothetical protein